MPLIAITTLNPKNTFGYVSFAHSTQTVLLINHCVKPENEESKFGNSVTKYANKRDRIPRTFGKKMCNSVVIFNLTQTMHPN